MDADLEIKRLDVEMKKIDADTSIEIKKIDADVEVKKINIDIEWMKMLKEKTITFEQYWQIKTF